MTVVQGDVDVPGVQPATLTGVRLFVELAGTDGHPVDAWETATGDQVVGRREVTVGSGGAWSVDVVGNAAITPAGTRWKRSLTVDGKLFGPVYWDVPAAGGPFTELAVLDDVPAAVETSALAAHKAQAAGAHAASAISVPSVGLLSATNVAAQLAQTEGYLRTVSRRVAQEHDLLSFGPNVTENTLHTFTIPGGQAVGGHEYRMRLWGEIRNDSGGDTTLTFRVKKNGTSMTVHNNIIVPTGGADFRWWEFELTQFMDNDFSLNLAQKFFIGPLNVASTISSDNIANRGGWRQQTLTAADWAVDTTFSLTSQFTVSATIRRHGADMTWTFTEPG